MALKIATSLRSEGAGDILAKPPPHSILSPQLTLLPSPKPRVPLTTLAQVPTRCLRSQSQLPAIAQTILVGRASISKLFLEPCAF